MEYAYLELGNRERMDNTLKAIKERKRIREDLEKRSAELRAEAVRIRHTDAIKARMLEHRGIVLADEAYRIKKENEKGMTTNQLRKSTALARLALARDGIHG